MRLWNYLKEKMLQHPAQKMCENHAEMTFEELIIWAEAFSKRLDGIKCCAILCSSEMASAMSILACFAAGVTAVPLCIRYGTNHCKKILDFIDPDAIITDEGELCVVRILDSKFVKPKKHPALIMCTSGTTGVPKGVMLSEKNILTNVSDISTYFDIGSEDTILISRSIYHCAVLTGELLTSLTKGTKIYFYSKPFNPQIILELIAKHRITVFCSTPTLLSRIVYFRNRFPSDSLRHICISGECMNSNLGQAIHNSFPNTKIYHVYGLTEASPRVSYLPPELFFEYSNCVGFPLKNVSIKIINSNGNLCDINEEGVLWVKGKNIMMGYYQDPEKTSSIKKKNWLCTGDIALKNEAGLLEIKGRADEMIIKSGMNIYPSEIEAAIKNDYRVKEVYVYGYDNKFGKQIGMKVSGDFTCVEEVKKLCSAVLPLFQIPSKIQLKKELEKNGSGKIVRRRHK